MGISPPPDCGRRGGGESGQRPPRPNSTVWYTGHETPFPDEGGWRHMESAVVVACDTAMSATICGDHRHEVSPEGMTEYRRPEGKQCGIPDSVGRGESRRDDGDAPGSESRANHMDQSEVALDDQGPAGQSGDRKLAMEEVNNNNKDGGGTRAEDTTRRISEWITDAGQGESRHFTVKFVGEPECLLICSIREDDCSQPIEIIIADGCVDGVCACSHSIASCAVQLKPCRVFCELFLRGDTDPDWHYILRGVVFGFNVINPSCTTEYDAERRRIRDPEGRAIVEDRLNAEIASGCVAVVDCRPTCLHDIFCIPKDGGGGRSIVDCSKPDGRSVNSFTDRVAIKFSYNSVDDVAAVMEQGDFLATVDIKDAYRAVSIHPRDRDRQGLHWDFDPEKGSGCTYMKDNRLCMGLSSSPYVFSKISDLVVRCAIREGVTRVVNYLDDFCIISSNYDTACRHQRTVVAILRRMGFFVSFTKMASPARMTRFLGIDIDTVNLEMSLPQDKLQKLMKTLEILGDRRKATRHEIECLGGLLAHCSKVIKGGRTFCRRIYNSMEGVREPHFKIRLTKGFREDVTWWRNFAAEFNGKAKILGRFAIHVSTYSDASNWGYGASHGKDWVVGAFDPEVDNAIRSRMGHHHSPPDKRCLTAHINVREMWAAYCAAVRWGHLWADSVVVMVTDSTTVRAALSTGSSRCPEIMYFVRRLFWLACEHNFELESVYIRSGDNIICDALSRLEEPASLSRLRKAGADKVMCCGHIFKGSALYTSRGGGAGQGEAGVPGTLIRS